MIVYEAFRPSGYETPACTAGLFRGDVACIREFVALTGDRPCELSEVSVFPREVAFMDKGKLTAWKAAKKKVTEGAHELAKILGSD